MQVEVALALLQNVAYSSAGAACILNEGPCTSPIPPLYLPYISPTSPLHLPVSQVSRAS